MATTQQLHINGTIYPTDADSEASLLFVLRDHLNLLGSKYGRAEGQCGACTVLSDGKAGALVSRGWEMSLRDKVDN